MGLGEGGICSTLTTEVTLLAPGSGLISHTPESLNPFLPASSPLGRFGVLEAGMNLGRCLLSSRSCILSRRLLVAPERREECRAVEQVVPERETGKPVVASPEERSLGNGPLP